MRGARVAAADLVMLLAERALLESRSMTATVDGELYVLDEFLDPVMESDVRVLARIHLLTDVAHGFVRLLRWGPVRRERAARHALRYGWSVASDPGRRWIVSRMAAEGPGHVAALRRIVGPDVEMVEPPVLDRRIGWPRSVLGLAQLDSTPWGTMRSGSGDAGRVSDDLAVLLFGDGQAVEGAAARLAVEIESQGHLFECAPAVVTVVLAAVAERAVPPVNLARALGLVGRTLGGPVATAGASPEQVRLREECRRETMKAYWILVHTATASSGSFIGRQAAREVLELLDEEHARALLAASDRERANG